MLKVALNNNFWPMFFIKCLTNICKKLRVFCIDMKTRRCDSLTFSAAMSCNHDIAKHTLSLQYQKHCKFAAIFLKNLRVLHRSNKQNLSEK